MLWELVLCIGIYWGGCGRHEAVSMPNEEACYRALKALRTDESAPVESQSRRGSLAYCAPKQNRGGK